MKIYFFEIQAHEKNYLTSHLKNLDIIFIDTPLTLENVAYYKDAEIISIFLKSCITPDIITQLPSLKYIITRSTGFDHINIEAAGSMGIAVSYMKTYATRSVAEYTFALLLALSRNIVTAALQVKEGIHAPASTLHGFDLYGKVLGVIGVGRIGQRVIQIAECFGMRCVGFDCNVNKKQATAMHCVWSASLQECLEQADVITLHVPYTPHTHHLINEKTLKAVKDHALLINTARGAVVDTKSLYYALKERRLAGAALDVIECEEHIFAESSSCTQYNCQSNVAYIQKLLTFNNVIITPHNAYNTNEAQVNMLYDICLCIRHYIEGKAIYHNVFDVDNSVDSYVN